MNLDHLIGKYLDGELTSSEDKLLREMIGGDAMARETFDSAVEVHMALKEDAQSIELPEGLAQETEDLVLMRILSADSFIAESREPERATYLWRTTLVAALLALFMIGGSIAIYDGHIPELRRGAGSNLEQAEATGLRVSVDENGTAANTKSQTKHFSTQNNRMYVKRINSLNSGSIAQAETPAQALSQPTLPDFQAVLPEPVSLESVTGASAADSYRPARESAQRSLNSATPSQFSALSNVPFGRGVLPQGSQSRGEMATLNLIRPNIEEIQLSSFYGSDVMRGGLPTSENHPIISFSQSIAYSLNSNSRIGLEVGMISFQTDQIVTINVSGGSLSGLEEFVPGYNPENYISLPVNVTRDNKIFWGSAFYERTIFAAGGASLESRVGTGFSRDGLISFGRLFGKYEVVPGLSLTGGAEGKLFQANPYRLTQDNADWKSTLSIIYGLQFNF